MNYKKLSKAHRRLKDINLPLSKRIMDHLHDQDLNQTELWIKTREDYQSKVAYNVRLLKNAGVVDSEREGKFVYYSLNYNEIERINSLLKAFNDGWLQRTT